MVHRVYAGNAPARSMDRLVCIMRGARHMLWEVRRALALAFLFSGCIAVLALALPYYVAVILEATLRAGTIEPLVLMTAVVAVAMLMKIVLELARERTLHRAAIWLDHTLGRHLLEIGLRHGRLAADVESDARALALVRQALIGPLAPLLLALPWLPLVLAGLILIHPLIGAGVCAAVAGVLVLIVLRGPLTATARARGAAALATAEMWRLHPPTNGAVAAGQIVGEWERAHRGHVAAAYAETRRTSLLVTLARLLLSATQLAVWAGGAWLVMHHGLSPVSLVVAGLLAHHAVALIDALLAGLGEVTAVHVAWARLVARTSTEADAATPDWHAMPVGHALRLVAVDGQAVMGGRS